MKKILIIDDEEIIFDGIELFSQEQPDIVIVDYKLPGLNGIEILKRIKAQNKNTEGVSN